MAKKMKAKSAPQAENLPPVSKQTAGGIGGAVLGAMIGGPVGAIAGGVAGAMVGNSAAKGNKPIQTAYETIQSQLPSKKTVKGAVSRAKKALSLTGTKKKSAGKKSSPPKKQSKKKSSSAKKALPTKKAVKKSSRSLKKGSVKTAKKR